jgi:hypothetical protein
LTVVNEIEEKKMPSKQGLECEVKYDEISHVKLALTVLPVAEGPDLVQNIDLDDLDQQHKD